MLHACLTILFGLTLISIAADRFVVGASAIARNFGVPPLLVGLTIVALGTSAPEIMVSATAAWQKNPELAIGNVLGSNIANIGLVLAIAAMISPLHVRSQILRREYPLLLLIMLLTWLLMLDGNLNRLDGWILLLALAGLMVWMIWQGLKASEKEPLSTEFDESLSRKISTAMALFWFSLGLILLPLSAKMLVDASIVIAKFFHLSDFVIGLTIVAIGTSLPEIGASVVGALKNEPDIALGNILGSNMFNLLAVLPFPALLQPGDIERPILTRDIPVMFLMTIVLLLVAYGFRGPGHIKRWEGALLLLLYIAYLTYLIMQGPAN